MSGLSEDRIADPNERQRRPVALADADVVVPAASP
jgi:hypothetical protein